MKQAILKTTEPRMKSNSGHKNANIYRQLLFVSLHVFELVRLCCGGANAPPRATAVVMNGGLLCG